MTCLCLKCNKGPVTIPGKVWHSCTDAKRPLLPAAKILGGHKAAITQEEGGGALGASPEWQEKQAGALGAALPLQGAWAPSPLRVPTESPQSPQQGEGSQLVLQYWPSFFLSPLLLPVSYLLQFYCLIFYLQVNHRQQSESSLSKPPGPGLGAGRDGACWGGMFRGRQRPRINMQVTQRPEMPGIQKTSVFEIFHHKSVFVKRIHPLIFQLLSKKLKGDL